MIEPRDDEALQASPFERLAAGELAALADIYDEHGGRLYGHALWLLGHPEDAEDAVQCVFAKLVTLQGSALLGVAAPAAYLHRMLRHAAIDALRRRRRRSEAPLEEVLFEPAFGRPRRGPRRSI